MPCAKGTHLFMGMMLSKLEDDLWGIEKVLGFPIMGKMLKATQPGQFKDMILYPFR